MSENELVQLATSGDEGAFRELWKRLSPLIYRVVQKHIDSPENRAEVLNDCRMALWESLPSFKHGSKLSTWAYRVCTNICLKYYRDHVAGEEDIEHIGDFHETDFICEKYQPEQDCAHTKLSALMDDKLPPDYCELLKANALDGYTVDDLSKKLGVPKATVSWRIRKAKEILKTTLLEDGYEMQELQ